MKSLVSVILVCVLSVGAAAYSNYSLSAYNASGSTTQSIVIPSATVAPGNGNRITIDSLTVMADGAGDLVTILKADTTGVTDNFTAVAGWDVGDATVTFTSDNGGPLFVGEPNTMYKVTVATTTTANSLTITGKLASTHEKL